MWVRSNSRNSKVSNPNLNPVVKKCDSNFGRTLTKLDVTVKIQQLPLKMVYKYPENALISNQPSSLNSPHPPLLFRIHNILHRY